MHEVMAAVARPRYQNLPDPIETADDSDVNLPPAIRFVDFRGDFDDYFEIKVIGPYPDTAARDTDLARLRTLPGDHGSAQFLSDRLGSTHADQVSTPERIVAAGTLTGFFAALDGCSESEYLGEAEVQPDPDEPHPGQLMIFDSPT